MAITRMVSPNRETGDYPIGSYSPVSESYYRSYGVERGHFALQTTYTDCVLATREENYHEDSDFYAVVWDQDTQSIRRIDYATTRGWTYPNRANVDATEAVKAQAIAWLAGFIFERLVYTDVAKSRKVETGKRVKVVKGRKVPHGTIGEVFYRQEQIYSPRYRNGYKQGPDAVKLGIALSDKKVCKATITESNGTYTIVTPRYDQAFVDFARRSRKEHGSQWNKAKKAWITTDIELVTFARRIYSSYVDVAWTYERNVEIIDPDTYRTDDITLMHIAAHQAQNEAFHVPFTRCGILM